jgi:Chromo (CHRromatin Organisation MOdifier) domain
MDYHASVLRISNQHRPYRRNARDHQTFSCLSLGDLQEARRGRIAGNQLCGMEKERMGETRMFLVMWLGYTPDQNTWEPVRVSKHRPIICVYP